jgi:hypothetical protein
MSNPARDSIPLPYVAYESAIAINVMGGYERHDWGSGQTLGLHYTSCSHYVHVGVHG